MVGLALVVLVTGAMIAWGVTVLDSEVRPRPGAALAGLVTVGLLGAIGTALMAHAAVRPHRWTTASVVVAICALIAGVVVVGAILIGFANIE